MKKYVCLITAIHHWPVCCSRRWHRYNECRTPQLAWSSSLEQEITSLQVYSSCTGCQCAGASSLSCVAWRIQSFMERAQRTWQTLFILRVLVVYEIA